MDILDRIHELLDEKFDGKPELLAECMGESEATVSRWLFGVNDFTADFSKVAYYFEEPVIAVASTDEGGALIHSTTFWEKECPVVYCLGRSTEGQEIGCRSIGTDGAGFI